MCVLHVCMQACVYTVHCNTQPHENSRVKVAFSPGSVGAVVHVCVYFNAYMCKKKLK